MQKILLLSLTLAALFLVAPSSMLVGDALSATNPFLSPGDKSATQDKKVSNPAESKAPDSAQSPFVGKKAVPASKKIHSGIYGEILKKVMLWQKTIRREMTGFAKGIHAAPLGKSFFMFLAFSFIYGVVHAIGPGHGKSVVCAYFMSRRGGLMSAGFLSWLITLVHVGSATLAVCGAYLLLETGMSGFEEFNSHLQTVSFSIIIVIGLWLFISALMNIRKALAGKVREEAPEKCASIKEMATVAFFTGIVPCPGAAIILVYTLSTGILWAGLISMVVLATGMALTTFLFAYAASTTRSAMTGVGSQVKLRGIVSGILATVGSLIITAFGAVMLSAHLG